MATITIVGAGMMGSAMAAPARDNGHAVRVVGTPLDREIIEALRRTGEHPGMRRTLPEGTEYFQTEETRTALLGADLVIGGVSSFGVRWFGETVLPLIPVGTPLLSVTKGLEGLPGGGLRTFPEALGAMLPAGRRLSLNAVGGPCTSYELADRNQTEVAFCGEDLAVLRGIRALLRTDYYHISLSTDVMGVEAAVALKNAYALGVTLAVGMAERRDGPDAPQHYNAQAALFAQSVREMGRLLALLGGGAENIVYGAGDLYVTVFGGRTRRLGTLLGRGLSFAEAMEALSGVTLESVEITRRIGAAIRDRAARGEARLSDYPLLTHVDDLIAGRTAARIPWEAFVTEK